MIKQVKYIYILQSSDWSSNKMHLLIPDGTFELIFNFGGAIYHRDERNRLINRPDFVILGGFREKFSVQYSRPIHIIGVVFNHGYASAVLKDQANIYSGQLISVNLILGQPFNRLVDRLSKISNSDSIREVIETWFAKNIFKDYQNINIDRLNTAISLIQKKKGNITLDELLSSVYMSGRNFRRVFTDNMGLSPKEYIRIVRAKNIIHLIKNRKKIIDVAYNLNYYDPSHLVNDFKKISGLTPLNYINQLNAIDESFIKQSDYADG